MARAERKAQAPHTPPARATAAKKKLFRGVQFIFVEFGRRRPPILQRGMVTLRPNEIAIELVPDEDLARYQLVAKRYPNGSYSGSGVAGDGVAVRAHFSELGQGDFLGRWIEDEVEYWFHFSLGRKPSARHGLKGKHTDDGEERDHAPLTKRDLEERERAARNGSASARGVGDGRLGGGDQAMKLATLGA
jgi:hypothetical protein